MAIKWKRAEYINGPRGGHYSIQGFTEVTERYEEERGTRRRLRFESAPVSKTIIPAVGVEIHEQTGETLQSGEFLVQASGDNMKKLKRLLERGLAQMVDEEEHNEMLGIETETIVDEDVVEKVEGKVEDLTLKGSDVDKQLKEKDARAKLEEIQAKKKKGKAKA